MRDNGAGRRAIFALCPAGWKRGERRTTETGEKSERNLPGGRRGTRARSRGFSNTCRNPSVRREESVRKEKKEKKGGKTGGEFSWLPARIFLKVATTRNANANARSLPSERRDKFADAARLARILIARLNIHSGRERRFRSRGIEGGGLVRGGCNKSARDG